MAGYGYHRTRVLVSGTDQRDKMQPSWPTRDFLADRCGATPERTGVIHAGTGREWSYRELDAVVDRVAHQLRTLDAVPASGPAATADPPRIGCLLSTRVEFVVVFYAAMRAGLPVVLLNTELTEDELEHHIALAEPEILICERDSEPLARALVDGPVLSVDEPHLEGVSPLVPGDGWLFATDGVAGEPADGSEPIEPVERGRDATAVIPFTSGTTGDPKGVRLTLGNLAISATASAFRLGVTPSDRWLCCLPVYHMGGLAPVVRSVLYGTTLVIQESFDAEETAEVLADHDITGVSLVPTQLTRLLDAGWSPSSAFRTVLLGGAPASESLIERAQEAGVPVCPTYGLTETASQVATARPETAAAHPGTVGQPLVFTEVTIVDDGEPVGPGERGELVVDGPTVTPGYLDSEYTDAAFGDAGLHTGDIGYRDEDGRLWIVGRRDDLIISGGELVVPSEVVAALETHTSVESSAVVGIEDDEWGERVAALVTGDGSVTTDELQDHCRTQLAGFKLPRTIVWADEIPRTASGTVDRERVRAQLETLS